MVLAKNTPECICGMGCVCRAAADLPKSRKKDMYEIT
jgi:hypothetical protein